MCSVLSRYNIAFKIIQLSTQCYICCVLIYSNIQHNYLSRNQDLLTLNTLIIHEIYNVMCLIIFRLIQPIFMSVHFQSYLLQTVFKQMKWFAAVLLTHATGFSFYKNLFSNVSINFPILFIDNIILHSGLGDQLLAPVED